MKSFPDHCVLRLLSMIGIVARQVAEAQGIGHDIVYFVNERAEITIVLLGSRSHMQIAEMHPRHNAGSIGHPGNGQRGSP